MVRISSYLFFPTNSDLWELLLWSQFGAHEGPFENSQRPPCHLHLGSLSYFLSHTSFSGYILGDQGKMLGWGPPESHSACSSPSRCSGCGLNRMAMLCYFVWVQEKKAEGNNLCFLFMLVFFLKKLIFTAIRNHKHVLKSTMAMLAMFGGFSETIVVPCRIF